MRYDRAAAPIRQICVRREWCSPTPVGADGFLMYRADQDKSWAIPRIESVEEWLEANEAEHGGPAALQFGAQGGS